MGAASRQSETVFDVLRRGFSLAELGIAMVVTAMVATIAVVGYQSAQSNVEANAAPTRMSSLQMEARRTIAVESLSDFPDTTLLVTALSDVPGVTVTDGDSDSPDEISVHKPAPEVVVFAAGTSRGCMVLVDRLSAAPAWLIDPEMPVCSAADVAAAAMLESGGSGTTLKPVDLS